MAVFGIVMKYCPNCGSRLSTTASKFCSECGANIQVSESPEAEKVQKGELAQPTSTASREDVEVVSVKLNPYDLGRHLENTTAAIFERMGYTVQKRQRVVSSVGTKPEIDLLVERGAIRRAVECKNYDPSRSVAASDIRVFSHKLNEISDAGISEGIFVTNTVFSDEAENLAQSEGIRLWDGDFLGTKIVALHLGRLRDPSLIRAPVLPVQMDYATASGLPLKNRDVVRKTYGTLVYHPYFKIEYELEARRKDTTGKHHVVSDDGTYFVDALAGDIINREASAIGVIGGFLKRKAERLQSKEDKLVAQDLKNIPAVTKPVLSTSDYDVSVGEPQMTEEEAMGVVRSHVVEKNERDISYDVKVRGEWETKSLRVVPNLKEVKILDTELIYVPKWDFQYEAGPLSFSRRFLASSGETLVDELAKCRKCALLKKQSVVVCEQCGKPLCEKHSFLEERYLCQDHISDALRQQIKDSGLLSRLGIRRKR